MSALVAFLAARSNSVPIPPESGEGPVPAQPIVTDANGGSGQADITWQQPSLKADGSALDSGDIVRYWVYVATAVGEADPDGSYAQRLEVTAPTLTRTVTSLSADTYYLAVTCESTYGESSPSFEYDVVVT